MEGALARLWVRQIDAGALCAGREGDSRPVLVGNCGPPVEASDCTHWWGSAPDLAPGSRAGRCSRSEGMGLEWAVWQELSPDATTLVIGATVTNGGDGPVGLGRCPLLGGYVELGETADETVMLCCSGTTSPSRVRRIGASSEPLSSKTIAQLYDSQAKLAFHAGFVTFDRMNTEHHVSLSPATNSVRLDSFCDFAGWELPPGETVETERLMVRIGSDPLACLEAWADDAAAHYQPRIWPKMPSGWLGWAWVDGFNVEPYESVVLRNAEGLRRRLPGHDIEYIWVSIGNLQDGLPGNWLEWNHDVFPGGVEHLVGELGERGLKLGFWMGSFWMCTALKDRIEELSDAILRKDGEPMVVCPVWSYGASGQLPKAHRPALLALDPTHPKTHAFLREVLSTYYDWGVRYYMIDFLHAVSDSTPGDFMADGYHDETLIRGPETYRAGLSVVREAAGEDTYLLSSTGPTYQNVGLMDACRVGNDYGEGRALNPESFFYPATFVINGAGFWTSHLAASNAMAAGYFTHRKLYLADSGNVLTVDKPIPRPDAEIAATIFGLNGGPLMLGDDIDRMSEERLALVRKCLPRLPECARPLDLFDSPEPDYPKLFHLCVERGWDTWHVVAVLNYGPDVLRQVIDPARLGLDPGAELIAWDFWNERYEGLRVGPFELLVPPGSAKVIRLTQRRDHPWLLSTDMHVRQGQAEVEACAWDAETMTLTVRAARPAGESGNLFVHVPPGLAIANPEGLWIAKDANDGSLIVRVACEFEGEPVEREIAFAPIGG